MKRADVGGVSRTYVVYVPRDYTHTAPWPLIVFLHGMGERGDDGLLQTEVGIGRAIRRHADRFPCLVLMPQCSANGWWNGSQGDIDVSLAAVQAEYNIDCRRISLTGFSMGGCHTWLYGAQQTDVYSALMPICGEGNILDGPMLARVPIWAFHGSDDAAKPVGKSREMVEAVRAAGGHVEYTEYTGVGHECWDLAYSDAWTIQWLLEQRKA